MPNSCCSVPKCSNREGGHMFPIDDVRKKAWVHAIHRVKEPLTIKYEDFFLAF